MGCSIGWVVTHLMVPSVNLQHVFQSSSEVAGQGSIGGLEGRVGFVAYRV